MASEPHPDVVRLVARFEANGVPPYEAMSVPEARLALEEVRRLQKPAPDVAEVRDLTVPGADGELAARLYHPRPGRKLPLVVYIHGGGWTLGSIGASDRPCRRLCLAGDCVVVAFDYRLAPETRFPGALEDCLNAVRWLAVNAGGLGADPEIVVLMGDSAGGNLAAATAHCLRDEPAHRISALVLLYPCLYPARNSPFASYTEQAAAPLMTAATMEWFWDHYLAQPADADNPLAVPLKADSFSGLPRTRVFLAELDPLRDEGLAYVEKLIAADVEASATVYPGAVHGFWWMDAALTQAAELDAELGSFLRSLEPRPS